MNIMMISKYPPIEGGVSSDTYWLAKELGVRGHKVFIVTNSWEVEEEFREKIDDDELNMLEPENVKVFSTKEDFKSPILESKYYSEKLLNIGLNLTRKENIDIIYSHYLLPYGIVGYHLKRITGIPHFIRHAGSDMGRLHKSRFLKTIFNEALLDADRVLGGGYVFDNLMEMGFDKDRLINVPPLVDPREFSPDLLPADFGLGDMPLFSYFGKISRLKKTFELIDAAARVKKDFRIIFVSGEGERAAELRAYAKSKGMEDKCIFMPFQPPWKIPSIMRASTCVISPESDETPFLPEGTHYPKVVREAMACGRCAMIGKGVASKGIYSGLTDDQNIISVNPEDANEFRKKLEMIIDGSSDAEKIGKKAYEYSIKNEDFLKIVSGLEKEFYRFNK